MTPDQRLQEYARRARDIAPPDNLTTITRAFDLPRNLLPSPAWYDIRAADDSDATKVYIYDFIDPWGVDATQFLADLDAITSPSINLHINSGGGNVFDAVAIYSGLRNHSATVNVAVDGIAASAASFIAMAGDTIGIEKPARMMIHDARGIVIGDPAAMRDMADLLDEVSDTIAEIYADRAGETTATWRARMTATTWYSSQQAVDAKLADSIIGNTSTADNREQQIRARARVAMRGSAA